MHITKKILMLLFVFCITASLSDSKVLAGNYQTVTKNFFGYYNSDLYQWVDAGKSVTLGSISASSGYYITEVAPSHTFSGIDWDARNAGGGTTYSLNVTLEFRAGSPGGPILSSQNFSNSKWGENPPFGLFTPFSVPNEDRIYLVIKNNGHGGGVHLFIKTPSSKTDVTVVEFDKTTKDLTDKIDAAKKAAEEGRDASKEASQNASVQIKISKIPWKNV
ncbi:hypothetical protein [Aneurinibacillus aneurinilyticus]|nr:hypothetical protein [Aneurinibacillus aneurinilyticus]MED0709720.1 hypothetical protein [Aneurinibacillus aneurinilyticus]MED0724370.1 hypothetical protein [Aneurinibacillus aneurinilyticus]MED0730402.1 hypothetical protein [Aneurinibacillus aneurinilyticus]MED0739231.1 hypothetical protein [Aneurinibacillus aneurinilyticus]